MLVFTNRVRVFFVLSLFPRGGTGQKRPKPEKRGRRQTHARPRRRSCANGHPSAARAGPRQRPPAPARAGALVASSTRRQRWWGHSDLALAGGVLASAVRREQAGRMTTRWRGAWRTRRQRWWGHSGLALAGGVLASAVRREQAGRMPTRWRGAWSHHAWGDFGAVVASEPFRVVGVARGFLAQRGGVAMARGS